MATKTPQLTTEEYNALAPIEKNLDTAVNAQWARYPGAAACETLENILRRVSYPGYRLNRNCSTCILNALQDVGRLYFAKKAQLEAEKAAETAQPAEEETPTAKKVAVSEKKAPTVKAKKIQTKK